VGTLPKMRMRPVFLVGVPRSGTTMLRLILDSHPCVFTTVELPWIGGNYYSNGDYGPDASVRRLYRRLVELSADVFGKDMECVRVATRAFVDELVRIAMADRSAAVWVEKTPDNIVQVPFLAELFPDAKFVRVIRDGRDVALSTVNVAWKALNYFVQRNPGRMRWINVRQALSRRLSARLPAVLRDRFLKAPRHAHDLEASTVLYPVANTFQNALHRWQVWNELYDYYTRKLGTAELTVKYEDLLRDPHRRFPEIFEFIGIGWDDAVLNYGEYRHEVREGDVGGISAMKFRGIAPENAYKWKARLTGRQRRLVRRVFDPYLLAAGYEPTPSS
jgi:protein-tyrosine sulfotransferase